MSVTIAALKATLAASTTFQSVTGSANSTEAAGHIFYGLADEHIAAQVPPRAVLDFDETNTERMGGISTTGTLSLLLQIPVGSDYLQSSPHQYAVDPTKWNDAWLDFFNKVGAIWREMDVLMGASPYLAAVKTSMGRNGLDRIAEDRSDALDENDATLPAKDVWYCELLFDWRGG